MATAKLEVRGTLPDDGPLRIEGKLRDDATNPVIGVQIFISLAKASAPETPLALPMPPSPAFQTGNEDVVKTDTAGRFSLEIPVDKTSAYVVSLRTEKTNYISASKETLHVELGKKSVELEFMSWPRAL
ncbi:MAG: hypothetical protein ACXWP4_22230, partial [Polyangiales bacterium]